MSPSNHAAWLKAKQDPVMVVEDAPYTHPSTNELVISTKAIAINPADSYVQKMGILVTQFPAILGCDVAGEVVEVHESLATTFSVGDRVIGSASPLQTKDNVYYRAGFQEYVVLQSPSIAKIPKELSYEDAVVLPLGITTASMCLFPKELLVLSLPSDERRGQGKTLLIWGASSSVGSCGVQLATQAGYEVVAVASKKNHDMVLGLGAKWCFDHNDPTVVDDVVAELTGKDVVGAYDSISKPTTTPLVCEILDRSGAKKIVASVSPAAATLSTRGVRVQNNFSTNYKVDGIDVAIWKWLENALAEGKIQCMPPHEVVGRGLESVQEAVDLMGKGVSAKKLVVTM